MMISIFRDVFLFFSSILIVYRVGVANRNALRSPTEKQQKKKERVNENTLFDTLFSNDSNAHFVNSNINPELYFFETFQKLEGKEEDAWKSRILLKNTLQGNIILFYDIYKQAFSYFSDTQMPYKILNECAMKYVRIFQCRDFYVDTNYLPVHFQNPFNEMKKKADLAEKDGKEAKKKHMKIDFESDVFLKSKKVSFSSSTTLVEETKPKYVNTFIYLGKLQNYSFLQPKLPQLSSAKLFETLKYADFKKGR